MNDTLQHLVLDSYFRSQRDLIAAEQTDDSNVIISFPFHYSGGHRIELNVSALASDRFLVTDMAQTIGELKQAGYGITSAMRSRIEKIAAAAKIRVVRNYLVADYERVELGTNLHYFAEAAKTIGDAYLAHRQKRPVPEDALRAKVRDVLLGIPHVMFRESVQIGGSIESHKLDFYMPPNGGNGFGISVLAHPTRLLAEAWAFKAQDLKNAIKRLRIGLVYDETSAKDDSREIISRMIDMPVPAADLERLPDTLLRALHN